MHATQTTPRPREKRARLLIVDDDRETAGMLARSLADWGFACQLAASGERALEMFADGFDVVLSDVYMGDGAMNGIELLTRLQLLDPLVPVVLMTGFGSIDAAVGAMRRGAFDYVTKPLEAADVRAIVERALMARAQPAERDGAPSSARRAVRGGSLTAATVRAELVTRSPAMKAVLERVELVAGSASPVLVLGESGTGKELVARAIHALGPRHTRPFVAINAAAIPETLLESELFGHVRGAFTGATHARRGLLAEADHGTMLLDEIGDMPLALQPKLLRVLQAGEVRAIGGDTIRRVDVRLIAATHRHLPTLIAEGRFREDLFYRLDVVPILVPPLRNRREDIPELVRRFVTHARERTPTSLVRWFTDDALEILVNAPWPGNVRELASAVERLVVLGRDEVVTARDVAFVAERPAEPAWSDATREMWSLKKLNESYVAWVLARTGGRKAEAAKVLGIDLSTLYRWQRGKERG